MFDWLIMERCHPNDHHWHPLEDWMRDRDLRHRCGLPRTAFPGAKRKEICCICQKERTRTLMEHVTNES